MSNAAEILAKALQYQGAVTQESVSVLIGSTVERARELLDELVDFGVIRRRGRQFHYNG